MTSFQSVNVVSYCKHAFFFFFCRSIQEDVSVDAVILNGDNQSTGQISSVDKTEASVADFEAVRIM
jgi:hypothetical protein